MTLKLDPTEAQKYKNLNKSVLICLVGLPLGSFWVMGLDFAKATLVGCLVVAVNLWISQRLIARIILERKAEAGMLVSYLVKLGGTLAVMFLVVVQLKMDLAGLMLGLSSVFLAILLSSLLKPQVDASASDPPKGEPNNP